MTIKLSAVSDLEGLENARQDAVIKYTAATDFIMARTVCPAISSDFANIAGVPLGGQEEVTRVERICVFLPTVPLSFFCSLYPSLFLPPLLPGTLGEREGEDGEKENDHGRGSTDSL